MKSLILYNWEVRDDYIKAFEELSNEELIKNRNAGLGSILKTFLHIIDVEYSWMCAIFNKPEIIIDLDQYKDLKSISELSIKLRTEIKEYLNEWADESDNDIIVPSWIEDSSYSKGEIFRHVLVHEVHHIGQLSIWARELGVTPPSPNFIGRNFSVRANDMS